MERILQYYLTRPRGADQYKAMVQEFYGQFSIQQLLHSLCYSFRNPELLFRAFTHSSFWNEWCMDSKGYPVWPNYGSSNERLEFLGDSIWSLFISTKLFKLFPNDHEGTLTQFRMALTNGETLSELSKALGLTRNCLVGRGLQKPTPNPNTKLHENIFEALWAAIYLDSSFQESYQIFENFCQMIQLELGIPLFERDFLEKKGKTPKTIFGEMCFKKFQMGPQYKIIQTQNALTQTPWEIAVYIGDNCIAQQVGSSKKELENALATIAINTLTQSGNTLC